MNTESKARQVARRAFGEAGVEPDERLLGVLEARIVVDESGVRGADGRTVWDNLQDLRNDPDHAAAFARLRPSFEGKAWSEMTPDEKVAYTTAKYGG